MIKFLLNRLSILLLIISSLAFIRCDDVNEFPRSNPSDPYNEDFIPIPNSEEKLDLVLTDIHQFKITWPQYVGVSKYNLFRKRLIESDYELISQFESYRDTTYIDKVKFSGSYKYKIEIIPRNNNKKILESNTWSSNIIEIDTLYTSYKLGAPIYTQINDNNDLFMVRRRSYSKTPYFGLYNLNTNISKEFTFSSYYFNHGYYIRAHHIYPLTNNKVLIFFVYRSRAGGWGSKQQFLGLVCNTISYNCVEVGKNNLPYDERLDYMSFARINEKEILITSARIQGSSFRGNIAFKLNIQNQTLVEITPPNNNFVPTSLENFKNEMILACSDMSSESGRKKCQLFNNKNNDWTNAVGLPQPMISTGSVVLENNDILLYGSYEKDMKVGFIYKSLSETWSQTAPSENDVLGYKPSTGASIAYYSFDDPLVKTSDNKVLALTVGHEESNSTGVISDQYFIEVYNTESDEWENIFLLPHRVTSISKYKENEFILTTYKSIYKFVYPID